MVGAVGDFFLVSFSASASVRCCYPRVLRLVVFDYPLDGGPSGFDGCRRSLFIFSSDRSFLSFLVGHLVSWYFAMARDPLDYHFSDEIVEAVDGGRDCGGWRLQRFTERLRVCNDQDTGGVVVFVLFDPVDYGI